MEKRYIVLDDLASYFDSTCRNFYLVDGVTGLTADDAKMVPLWANSLS